MTDPRRDHGRRPGHRDAAHGRDDPAWSDERRERDAAAREAERQYRADQEARRAWQERDDERYRTRYDQRGAYENAWTHAGRYHPHFGEPRVWGDPFNIEPGYPRDRPQGYNPHVEPHTEQRDILDRAGDEVLSWFGDSGAEQRRERDHRHGPHRGRGPKGYTRSDERINEEIHDRLGDADWLDASDIEVLVEKGEVTLSGHVERRADKRLAEDIAESVSGVAHCQNNLRVRPRTGDASGARKDR